MKTYEVTVRFTLVDVEGGTGHDLHDRARRAEWHTDLQVGIDHAVAAAASRSTIAVSNIRVSAEPQS